MIRILGKSPYKQEVGGSNPSAPIELTGLWGVRCPQFIPANGSRIRLLAVRQRLPELVLVGLLVALKSERRWSGWRRG